MPNDCPAHCHDHHVKHCPYTDKVPEHCIDPASGKVYESMQHNMECNINKWGQGCIDSLPHDCRREKCIEE